jgi:hypothetical protein
MENATPVPVLEVPPSSPARTHPGSIFRRVLQDRATLLEEIADGHSVSLRAVALASLALTAMGGVGLGVANGALQACSSALKLPLVSFGAIAVCLPALYVFSALNGTKLSLEKTLRYIAVALGLRGAVIAGLAPLLIFFSTVGSPYGFLLLLAALVLGAAEFGFLRVLDQGIRTFKQRSHDPISLRLVRGWMVLYSAVLLQLTWSLRPLIGEPGRAFSIVGGYPGDGNMFTYFAKTVGHLVLGP